MSNPSIAGALIWKFLERGGIQVTQFIVSIVIARLLLPSAYGAVAILMIFISIATVFVQSGLNTALIQKKDADDTDISSVFLYSLVIASTLYLILFFSADAIASFFRLPQLTNLLRVLALTLFPGAVNAVQLAILSKNMEFKKQFYAGIIACIISGAVGIIMAYKGFESWALVGQQLVSQVTICVILSFVAKWHLTFKISFQRTRKLLSFGVKLLGARLIDTLYHNLESLIIGKQFSPAVLAYCNKGKQFPLTLIDNIDGSIQSVMLPAYSNKQEDLVTVRRMLRKTISLCTYVVFPVMALLAAIGRPLISLLLGDNWLDCVPYLQLFCFISMLFPLQTANLQAINALGHSGVYLKLMWWKRVIGVVLLFASVLIWGSPFAVIYAALVIEVIAVIINAPANYKILGYTLRELLSDIRPNVFLAVVSGLSCYSLCWLINDSLLLLMCQIALWIIILFSLSVMTENSNWIYLIQYMRSAIRKTKSH